MNAPRGRRREILIETVMGFGKILNSYVNYRIAILISMAFIYNPYKEFTIF